VAEERGQIVRFYATRAKVPGFRPGKAPQAVIEKRFQREIAEELESRLVREALDEALRRDQLRVLDVRGPQSPAFHPDGAFSFVSNLILAPDFTLPDYKEIPVKVPKLEVSDEALERNLAIIRERNADFVDVTDRAATAGDFVVIDFTSSLDGQPLEEALGRPAGFLAGREGHWVKLAPDTFLPGFAEAIEGLETGASRDVTLTLPADFPLTELRQREIVLHVTLRELKQQVLPEIDEALVNRVAPGQTVEGFREFVRGQLLLEFERRVADSKVNQIIEYLHAHADFELPDDLITAETQSQADRMVERGFESGLSSDQIEAQQGEIFAAAGQRARLNLKSNFILQEIARAEKLAVTDKELLDHLAGYAMQHRQPLKKLVKALQEAGRLPGIRNSLLISKTIDFIVEQAKVETIDQPAEQLPESNE
jgi:trigger factor